MNKWPKCNWCCLLSLCSYIFLLTSCSNIKLPSFIPSLVNDKTQNNIEKSSVPTTDNQKSLLDEKLRENDKEITELRASLNNLNELKTKVENKNNELSRLKKELDRIANLNNSQTNQISRLKKELENSANSNNAQKNEITRLKKELENSANSNNAQKNEITRLKNELDQATNLKRARENEITRLKNALDQATNLKQAQENKMTRLKNELDQAINSIQARILEEIEESRFFEPKEIRKSNTTPIKIVIEEKPSFSCKGALKWDEKVICNNPSLAEWDRKISSAYKNALTLTHNNKAKNKLIARQEKWLNTRHQCKEDYDKILCLETVYKKQLFFLQGKHKSNQNLK